MKTILVGFFVFLAGTVFASGREPGQFFRYGHRINKDAHVEKREHEEERIQEKRIDERHHKTVDEREERERFLGKIHYGNKRKEFLRRMGYEIYHDKWQEHLHLSDPYEPNDSPGQAHLISYGDTLKEGVIDPAGDVDFFKFTGSLGDTVTIDIDARSLGSWLDSYIYLYDTDGVTELAYNDDWDGLDSKIMNFVLPSAGTFYIKVREYDHPYAGGSDYFYHIYITNVPVLVGAISGTITDINGVPIEGIYIDVCDATTYDWVSSGYTDASGYYIVEGLETGSYKLRTYNYQGYLDEWWDDKPDFDNADVVYVTAPDTVENINFELERGGCISGTITDLYGNPLEDVDVEVYDATTHNYVGWGYTDASGYYIVEGLETGSYKLRTYNYQGYLNEYYNDKPDWNSADIVNVTAPDTTENIDFELEIGGKIKGYVYGAAGPLEDVEVDAFNPNSGEWINGEYTGSDGSYTIIGLPTGDCKLFAIPFPWGGDSTHAFEWYNNKDDWSSANPVYVTAPDSVLNINFNLENCGYITGTVYEAPKGPIQGADVVGWMYINDFYSWLGFFRDETASDGSYRLTNLRTGNYKVMAGKSGYEILWYNNKPGSASADLVHVTMPVTTSGIDFYLPLTGIEEDQPVPIRFSFAQNYPNPFNSATAIRYHLPAVGSQRSAVSLKIYNILGQKVRNLVDKDQAPGSYSVRWDGRDSERKEVSSGVYFYRLEVMGERLKVAKTRRMVLLR